jgi:hypothetical protein
MALARVGAEPAAVLSVEAQSPLQKPLSEYAKSRISSLASADETAERLGKWRDGGRK